MPLFKRRREAPTFAEDLEKLATSEAAQPSLTASSDFVKQVTCSRCGAPKRLPSKTAYLYCDKCGALEDYDFRLANAGTNAGLTNTVFHHLIAAVQADLDSARSRGDQDRYRQLLQGVFAEWVRQCPQAASPRAMTDEDFRARMVTYLVETAVSKDFDERQAPLDARMNSLTSSLQRRPQPDGGAWLVSDGIWEVAALFKQQMEMAYARFAETGVTALDPDEAPAGVPLRMEYSTFCQGWLPHLSADDGKRLLGFFGLSGNYVTVDLTDTVTRRCGSCGAEQRTIADASAVVCEGCGRKLDVGGGEAPCRNCGAPLVFPFGVTNLDCPYCHTGTHRV